MTAGQNNSSSPQNLCNFSSTSLLFQLTSFTNLPTTLVERQINKRSYTTCPPSFFKWCFSCFYAKWWMRCSIMFAAPRLLIDSGYSNCRNKNPNHFQPQLSAIQDTIPRQSLLVARNWATPRAAFPENGWTPDAEKQRHQKGKKGPHPSLVGS